MAKDQIKIQVESLGERARRLQHLANELVAAVTELENDINHQEGEKENERMDR